MAKRTDLAAPTVIDPAAFVFTSGVYFAEGCSEDMDAMLGEWMDEKGGEWDGRDKATLMKSPDLLNPAGNFARKGTCDHCGAWFKWGSVYTHTSGKLIVVGNTCADNTLSVPTRRDLDVKRLKARMQAHEDMIRNAARACEQAITEGFVWLYAETHTNPTLIDIARKGLAWAGLTKPQVELINRIRYGTKAKWELDKEAREAQRAADEAAAEPVPVTTERIDVEGEIISTKVQDGYMPGSSVTKVLVKTTRGFKLWGTLPSAISNAGALVGDYELRGKRVKFSAKVERSKDDTKFGFFSRPTKAQVIQVTT